MPIIAVGVAVAADVGAAAAVAGTVGGIAAISTVTALEVVAAVGATVAAIGAVTGNKTLSTIGLVVGAVGGLGALAAGAGLLGDAAASSAPLFGTAPAASTAGAATSDAIDFAGDASSSGLIDVPPAPPGGVGAVDASGDVITAPTPGDVSTLASATTNGANPGDASATPLPPPDSAALQANLNAAPTDNVETGLVGETQISPPNGSTPVGNPITLPPNALAQGGVAAPGAGGAGTVPSGTGPGTVQTYSGLGAPVPNPELGGGTGFSPGGGPSPPTTLGSVFSDIKDFTKDNQLLSYGVLQGASSLLSGLTSTLTPAQVSALNAQAAANNAAAALTTQQTANLAMPKSVASSAPVTGTPATLVPAAPTGFINSQAAAAPKPASSAGVTGVAA